LLFLSDLTAKFLDIINVLYDRLGVLILAEINRIVELAKQAGKIIMSHYGSISAGDTGHELKDDNSPVTIADKEANDLIVKGLTESFPHIPVISEEGDKNRGNASTFFLVDPLDGTKEFIKGTGHFTVNIGLIADLRAFMGVIYAPTTGNCYYTDGKHAYKDGKEIKCRKAPLDGLVVVASKSHRTKETDDFIKTLKVKELINAGSSLKLCLVAEGKADIYPRFGRTMEWDTAAGHAIINAAGGSLTHTDGAEFLYGKNEIYENGWFIGRGHS
jgi:3'(2'), 5'-bisphosphate nucleotidase